MARFRSLPFLLAAFAFAAIAPCTDAEEFRPRIEDRLLAADDYAARYRTGVIDPRVEAVPAALARSVRENPGEYLDDLVAFLTADTADEFLIVKRIHDWISDSIAYDGDLFVGVRKTHDALSLGRTTCGGFSRIFVEMATHAGLEALYVGADGRNTLSLDRKSYNDHAWNAVRLRGKWYLVDTTFDSRTNYRNGEFLEKGRYGDRELFIRPEAKLSSYFPRNPDYQFVEPPITREDFMKAIRIDRDFYRFGVRFVTDMQSLVRQGSVLSEDGTLYELFDSIALGRADRALEIRMTAPPGVAISATLYDRTTGTYYNEHGLVYRENGETIARFTAPHAGSFVVTLRGRYHDHEPYWNDFYLFTLEAGDPSTAAVAEEDRFYREYLADHYGLQVRMLGDTAENGYAGFEILHPEEVSVMASIRNARNEKLDDLKIPYESAMSVERGRRTYWFAPPDGGEYILQLSARPSEDADGAFKSFGTIPIRGGSPGAPMPPPGSPAFTWHYALGGFEATAVELPERDGVSRIVIRGPEGAGYGITLRDADGTSHGEFTDYSIRGDSVEFRTTPPGEGVYIARISEVDSEEKWKTLASFTVVGTKPGPALPRPGSLRIYRRFASFGLSLVRSTLKTRGPEDPAVVVIDAPAGMKISGTVKTAAGERVRGLLSVASEGNRHTLTFADPGPGRFIGSVSVVEDGLLKTVGSFAFER